MAAHYTDPTAPACPDTGIVDCALVTTSSWSVVLGVPLAAIGLVWAIVVTALTVPWAWSPAAAWVDRLRRTVSGAGAATVLYLVHVGLFRIGAICLWCTAMHAAAVCLFAVVLVARATARGVVADGHEPRRLGRRFPSTGPTSLSVDPSAWRVEPTAPRTHERTREGGV